LYGVVGLKVRELIRQTCEIFEIEIVKGAASKDHVCLLVSAPPNLVPSEIMRRIKGRSANKLFEAFPVFMTKQLKNIDDKNILKKVQVTTSTFSKYCNPSTII